MDEQLHILEEELAEERPAEAVAEAADLLAAQPPVRHLRIKKAAAGLALAGTLAGVASQPGMRMDVVRAAASSVAEFLYEDTPLGVTVQAFDEYVKHEAGWDNPIETTVKTYYDPEHPTPHSAKVTNFVIPGFREMHDKEITGQLADASEHDYPTRYVEYGNQPVTPDSLARLIIKNLEEHPLETPEIGFTGHSMGGVLALEALARVHEMGYKLPKIAFIDLLSTPAGMPTARHSGLADFAVKTKIGQRAAGAYITDVIQQLDAQHFDVSWLPHDLGKGLSDVSQGASDALTSSQLKDLDEIDSEQALHNLLLRLKDVISPDTKVTYFGPVDSSTDTVVDDAASFNDFFAEFGDVFGITVNYVWWGDGHAKSDFDTNSRARRLYDLSLAPKVTPKPISPVSIPGITSPSPSATVTASPPSVIAAAGPAPSETAPSPTPSP